MKGFPNQVADLAKVATAVRVAADLIDAGLNVRDDDVFGEALVRAGVAGRGRPPLPVEAYLAQQRLKPIGGQSFRTTARGIRELLRAMGLAEQAGQDFALTTLGLAAADRPPAPIVGEEREFWRNVIVQIVRGNADEVSHPYQVLLRLVAARPNITRAQCALALAARNDSVAELDRIVALATLPEDQARQAVHSSKANWDNAKKVLPSFAEQLGDVLKDRQGRFVLATAPGAAPTAVPLGEIGVDATPTDDLEPLAAKATAARQVTPDTIGKAGITPAEDLPVVDGIDAAAMLVTIQQRATRLKAHNLLVRQIAAAIAGPDVALYEHPYDILAVFDGNAGLLIEVKTLDGSASDETVQVRDALSQLLYYEAFARRPREQVVAVRKVAFFDNAPSTEHAQWLAAQGITVMSGEPDGEALRALTLSAKTA